MGKPEIIAVSAQDHALRLASLGFPVFPCGGDKRPLVKWKDHASCDPVVVRNMWSQHPHAMIGMVTGPKSGLFVVDLDVDKETGEALGEASLKASGFGYLLANTPTVRTPSGGVHLYFRSPSEALRNTTSKIGNGIDTRGDGGYVIAPGSTNATGAYIASENFWSGFFPSLPTGLLARLSSASEAKPFTCDTGPISTHIEAGDEEVIELLGYLDPDMPYADWCTVLMALHSKYAGSLTGLEIADRWSAGGAKYRRGEVSSKWDSFSIGAGVGWGTIPALARQSGADLSEISKRYRGAPSGPKERSSPIIASKRRSAFYCPTKLQNKPVPDRQWLVPNLIPSKTVTLFSGDGGTGKSLVALQLAVAVATGRRWLDMVPSNGPVVFMSAEDDDDELHRRLADILAADGLDYSDLGQITMRSLAGEDALLAVETNLVLTETELFRELDARAKQDNPALIVLDTLADLYPANENDRAKVRQFIGMLRGLALRQNCAVLLLGHPSLSGLMSGSGTSGSTAWNNSVRSRLYLSRIQEDGYEPDPDRRVMTTMKANYGRVGGETHMTWENGVFVAERQPDSLDRLAMGASAQRVFLKLLTEMETQGRHVSANPGPTYAPSQFAKHPDAEGMTKRALTGAMETLLTSGKIKVEKHGSGAKERSHLARTDT